MVQPKYSPEEALQRIKLMMEYDTSKTLNENVETIKQPINEIAPLLGLIPMALPWLIDMELPQRRVLGLGYIMSKEEEMLLVKLKHFLLDVLLLIKT